MILKNTTIREFRAQMEHLQVIYPGERIPDDFFGSLITGEWKSSNNECLVFWEKRQLGYDYSQPPRPWGPSKPFPYMIHDLVDTTPPYRSVWIVQVRLADGELDKERGAGIIAFETGEQVEIEFVDGANDKKPIGASFQEFERVICKECSATPTPAENGAGELRRPTVKTGRGLMSKRKPITVQDIDQEAATVLMEVTTPPSKYTFTREKMGEVVTYIICSDGTEIGRLIFTPGTPKAPEARFQAVATATNRGVEASWQEHGTVTDLPDEEHERHQEFIAITKRIRNAIEFRYGLGEWAKV